ncbi:MAG: hypothetical protein S4CHLAM27_08170 [Chlamydiia bacterium]|nr:hypothetical protein [Chlamydiia bacterium]
MTLSTNGPSIHGSGATAGAPAIHGSGNATGAAIHGSGNAAGVGLSRVNTGAQAAAAAGRAPSLSGGKITIYTSSRREIKATGTDKNKTQLVDKATAKLAEIKDLVLQKMERDAGLSERVNSEDFNIFLNVSSGEVVIKHIATGEKHHIDMTSAQGANTPHSLEENIIYTIKEMQALLTDNEMMETSVMHVVETDYDQNYVYYVGNPKAENGVTQAISRLEKNGAAATKEQTQEDEQLFFDNRDNALFKSRLDRYKNAIEQQKAKIQRQTPTGTDKQVEEKRKKQEKFSKALQALSTSKELFLVTALRAFFDASPKRGVEKENAYFDKVMEFFATHSKFGASEKRLGATYRKYAVLITAAALYGDKDTPGTGGGSLDRLEYNRVNKRLYRKFLERKGVNPNTNLGLLGELLRATSGPDARSYHTDDSSSDSSDNESIERDRFASNARGRRRRKFKRSGQRTRAVASPILSGVTLSDRDSLHRAIDQQNLSPFMESLALGKRGFERMGRTGFFNAVSNGGVSANLSALYRLDGAKQSRGLDDSSDSDDYSTASDSTAVSDSDTSTDSSATVTSDSDTSTDSSATMTSDSDTLTDSDTTVTSDSDTSTDSSATMTSDSDTSIDSDLSDTPIVDISSDSMSTEGQAAQILRNFVQHMAPSSSQEGIRRLGSSSVAQEREGKAGGGELEDEIKPLSEQELLTQAWRSH